jgi:hypothetical protein
MFSECLDDAVSQESRKRGQVHLQLFESLRVGRCAGLTPAKRLVLASTIARKSSRLKARCCCKYVRLAEQNGVRFTYTRLNIRGMADARA